MDSSSVARAQGVYYLVTGAWPIVSMRTFEAVTGRKHDAWLVKTVGLLALAGGAVLLRHGRRRDGLRRDGARLDRALPDRARPDRTRPDGASADVAVADLGIGLALAFATSSAWYGGRGVVRRIYLGDALAEATFVLAWLTAARDARYSMPTTG